MRAPTPLRRSCLAPLVGGMALIALAALAGLIGNLTQADAVLDVVRSAYRRQPVVTVGMAGLLLAAAAVVLWHLNRVTSNAPREIEGASTHALQAAMDANAERPPALCVEHHQLGAVLKALRSRDSIQPVVLSAPSGQGKTTLAAQIYAHWRERHPTKLRIWIRVGSSIATEAELATAIMTQTRGWIEQPGTAEETVLALLDLLNRQGDGLMVLDGLDGVACEEPESLYMQRLIRGANRFRLLITTQRVVPAPATTHISLAPLHPADVSELFEEHFRAMAPMRKLPERAWLEGLLGSPAFAGQPMAVIQLAGYLAHAPETGFHMVLPQEVLDFKPHGATYHPLLTDVVRSYLGKEPKCCQAHTLRTHAVPLSPDSASLLRLAAFLDPDCVSRRALLACAGPMEEEAVEQAMKDWANRGLGAFGPVDGVFQFGHEVWPHLVRHVLGPDDRLTASRTVAAALDREIRDCLPADTSPDLTDTWIAELCGHVRELSDLVLTSDDLDLEQTPQAAAFRLHQLVSETPLDAEQFNLLERSAFEWNLPELAAALRAVALSDQSQPLDLLGIPGERATYADYRNLDRPAGRRRAKERLLLLSQTVGASTKDAEDPTFEHALVCALFVAHYWWGEFCEEGEISAGLIDAIAESLSKMRQMEARAERVSQLLADLRRLFKEYPVASLTINERSRHVQKWQEVRNVCERLRANLAKDQARRHACYALALVDHYLGSAILCAPGLPSGHTRAEEELERLYGEAIGCADRLEDAFLRSWMRYEWLYARIAFRLAWKRIPFAEEDRARLMLAYSEALHIAAREEDLELLADLGAARCDLMELEGDGDQAVFWAEAACVAALGMLLRDQDRFSYRVFIYACRRLEQASRGDEERGAFAGEYGILVDDRKALAPRWGPEVVRVSPDGDSAGDSLAEEALGEIVSLLVAYTAQRERQGGDAGEYRDTVCRAVRTVLDDFVVGSEDG